MKTVELVFRTIGERTADLSLELAQEKIRPTRVHVIEGVRPFSDAVAKMLRIRHECDFVVYVDADCLILDDLVPFLQRNTRPYVDCYVSDLFQGRIHCGVHITRIDVVRGMAETAPPDDDRAYVLRPESRRRTLTLKRMGLSKEFRNFNILHDHFQHYRDIFAKYALRELRSRSDHKSRKLALAMSGWPGDGNSDFDVARRAVAHARGALPRDAEVDDVAGYIAALPGTAQAELAAMGLEERGRMARDELDAWTSGHPRVAYGATDGPKVFGIGLSRTGTRSLTAALLILGLDTVHYPKDAQTFAELSRGDYRLSVLREYDGITDITVAPYYAQLDRAFPGSKFILTVRDRESWLRSAHNHWRGRSAFEPAKTEERQVLMELRRLLRASVYGCYEFSEERFSWVADTHVRNVLEHFKRRPQDLLVLDVCAGEGWEKLCPFLGREIPLQPFPHRGKSLSLRLAEPEDAA